MLEWLQGTQGQFHYVTPRLPRADEYPTWGAPSAKPEGRSQELPYAASEEETAELNRFIRGELKLVIIRKGKPGRQGEEQFKARIDPVW